MRCPRHVVRRTLPRMCIALALVQSSCAAESHSDGSPSTTTPARVIESADWDTVAVLGGLNDSAIVMPAHFVGTDDRFFVFDHGLLNLQAYSCTGGFLWSSGREGDGPGEFRFVRDVALSGDDVVSLLDVRTGRIVRLSSDGRNVGATPLPATGRAEQLQPLADNKYTLLSVIPTQQFITIDSTGAILSAVPTPWAGRDDLSFLATQGVRANEGERWVYAFTFGSGWFGFDKGRLMDYTGPYLEYIPFPEVEESAMRARLKATVRSALDVALAGDSVLILFAGQSDRAGRLIDTFRFQDGSYLGSQLLPFTAVKLTTCGRSLVLLSRDPYPRVFILRRLVR